jgi:hypothetical protein
MNYDTKFPRIPPDLAFPAPPYSLTEQDLALKG